MATEEEITSLKKRYAATLFAHRSVAGVGVERDADGEYALTVHLTGDASDLPSELDGHKVRYVKRGPYKKQ